MGKGLRCFFGLRCYIVQWRLRGGDLRCSCIRCGKKFNYDGDKLTGLRNPPYKPPKWTLKPGN